MDEVAREYLQQRLQAPGQLRGLIHECQTFAYFISGGFVVEPHFLKKASVPEIVLRWKGQEINVQCKCKMPGAGRQISQESFITLAGCIARDVKVSGQRLMIRIGSTGPVRTQDLEFLRRQAQRAPSPRSGPILATNYGRTFTVKIDPLSGSSTIDEIRANLSEYGLHQILGIWEPGPEGNRNEAVVVVGIDARPQEHPWDSLKTSLYEGARQLKDGSPGIVAIHYSDPIEEFEDLAPKSKPLRVFIGQLLDNLPKVGAVILSSEPDLQLPGDGRPGQARIYTGRNWRLPPNFPLGEPISDG